MNRATRKTSFVSSNPFATSSSSSLFAVPLDGYGSDHKDQRVSQGFKCDSYLSSHTK